MAGKAHRGPARSPDQGHPKMRLKLKLILKIEMRQFNPLYSQPLFNESTGFQVFTDWPCAHLGIICKSSLT
jgi:hypothetical protein